MATGTVTITAKVAWWLPYYLEAMIFCCQVFGTEPDWDKVYRTMMRAVRLYDGQSGRRIA